MRALRQTLLIRLVQFGHTRKTAKASLDGSCRCVWCVEVRCVERCSNAVPLLIGRTASIRRRVRYQCVGTTIPDFHHV